MISVDPPLDMLFGKLGSVTPPRSSASGLDRFRRLLQKLGNPHTKLPPVIHVAGTNGKGSTIAYLRAFLEAAGYCCHVYTSPHLLHYRERIRLAGALMTDDALRELVLEVTDANGNEPIIFFEATTAIAFLAFARTPADVVLLETGAGGRLDATNVIDHPLATIITTISFDHCNWFGLALSGIAGEKAGIMKPNVPCIVGHQLEEFSGEVLSVFKARARALGIPLFCCGEEWSVRKSESGMEFQINGGNVLHLPFPNLTGDHQIWNAGAALAALKTQKRFSVLDDAIAQGVTQAHWAGRLERITEGRLAQTLPSAWELWYDGGHNDSCGFVLAEQMQRWKEEDAARIHIVIGMMNNKNPHEFVAPMQRYADSISTFSFDAGQGSGLASAPFPADVLARQLGTICKDDIRSYPALAEAVASLPQRLPAQKARVLVTGTFYAYRDATLPL